MKIQLFQLLLFLSFLYLFINWKDSRSSRPEVFCKKDVLRNFAKFTGKHPCQSPTTLLKKRLWHTCFPVNFAKFLRTLFFTEHLRWLLLRFIIVFGKFLFINVALLYLIYFLSKVPVFPALLQKYLQIEANRQTARLQRITP